MGINSKVNVIEILAEDCQMVEMSLAESEMKEEKFSVHDFANLAKFFTDEENVHEDNIIQRIYCDTNDPSFGLVTDEQIVEEPLSMNLEQSDGENGKVQKNVSHEVR